MQNLTAFLRYHADRRPDATAIRYGDDRISYRDLLDRALRLAGWLQGQGVGEAGLEGNVRKPGLGTQVVSVAIGGFG